MIAITGGKGGCGKTTTAFGLAGILGRRRQKATIVDLDRDMPDCHLLAEVDRQPTLGAGVQRADLESLAKPVTGLRNVSVIPAPEETDPPTATLLSQLDSSGSYILDCPCGASQTITAALAAATTVVVVLTPTPAGITAAEKTVAMARSVGAQPQVGAVVGVDTPPSELVDRIDLPQIVGIPALAESPLQEPTTLSAYQELADAVTAVAGVHGR